LGAFGIHGGDAASATAATFGKATVGDLSAAFATNIKRVNEYTLPGAGTVTKLSIYLKPTSKKGLVPMRGIIYSNTNSGPGSLLATSDQMTFSSTDAAGWYSLVFAKPVFLSAGHYWIGVINGGPGGVAGYSYDNVANSRHGNSNIYTSGPSKSFGSYWADNRQMSLSATYTPAVQTTSTPTPTGTPKPSASPTATPKSTPSPTATPAPTPTSTPSPTPPPISRFFIASSPWNTPVTSTAVSAGFTSGVVNYLKWTWSVYHVNSSTPLSKVSVHASWGWPADPMVPIPAGAHATVDSDAEIVVVNDSTGQTFDFWGFSNSNGVYSAAAYGESNVYTQTGFGTLHVHGAGTRAIGASGLGGLILGSDLADASINHGISIELPPSYLTTGFVAPAISTDIRENYGIPGKLQEGERLAIPAGTPKPANLSPVGSKVWDALVKYGAIITDHDSGSPVFQVDTLSVTPTEASELKGDATTLMKALYTAN